MDEVAQNEVLEQFLDALDYPVAKSTLVAEAREAALADTLAGALEGLPEREYGTKADVVRALNAAA